MCNMIKKNQYPDKSEFESLYAKMSQIELAKYYQCNKKRIHKWILHFGLELRTPGGGNNRKYSLNKDVLQELVEKHYTNEDIIKILGIRGKSSLNKWLKKYGIKRVYNKTEYQKYKRRVRYLTESEYSKYHVEINPKNHPRTLCGVDGGYQLDHIMGVFECFYGGISAEKCASKDNLQMLPWSVNLKKRVYSKYNNKE